MNIGPFIALYALAALLLAAPTVGLAQDMDARARTAAAASRSRSGDSDALRQNYLTPGLGGGTVATIDGQTRFTPKLSCQNSRTLLELMVQPGATGDLLQVRIARDSNYDGVFDRQTLLPAPVSGICANGVISCRPGSWDACTYARWSVEHDGRIGLASAPMTDLAGCYCLNNSCGTNLAWGNMPGVLKDLGGGIIGALTTADPRIGVAEAQIDGPVIRYTGAQATACTANPTLEQTHYAAQPTRIAPEAQAAAESSSIFEAVKASPAALGKAQQIAACTITRETSVDAPAYDDIVAVSGAITRVTACGAGCRRYRIEGDGNCAATPPVFKGTFGLSRPERLIAARIIGMGAEDWVQARVNGQIIGYAGKRPWLTETLPSGDCAVDGSYSSPANHDFVDALRAGAVEIGARVRGGKDGRWGYVDVEIQVDTACTAREQLVDQCQAYAGQSQCRLRDETVDGVATWSNGVATGLRPLPQTRLVGGGQCTLTIRRDFFTRERRYACVTDNGALTPPDLSRAAYIIDRSTETMLADRTPTGDGSFGSTRRPFAMPDLPTVPKCEPVCKTRARRTNSDAAPDGVTGARQNSPSGWDIFYHGCSADTLCPAGPGEEIVTACGCLDDFPEAVAMMQTVRLAGADLVCTDDAP